jgi:type VI secretion system protein ImpF
MPDLTPKERLQPSLLDRLTDNEPDKRQEARETRVLSMLQLRKSVLRDLAWLLNTGNLASCEDIDAYPLVSRSVLNYGIPNFSGLTLAGLSKPVLEAALKQAILDFEPRILRDSVRVHGAMVEGAMSRNAIGFVIEGDLWGQPFSSRLYLRTEVDLESGHFTVAEMAGAGR